MHPENIIKTDILVLGGGMAGLFAAIKAREDGMEVILVDKGYAGKSGQTPFACGFRVFSRDWGHDLNQWVAQISKHGEYVNNRAWTEIILKNSYDRYLDLVSWGVKFRANENLQERRRDIKSLEVLEWKVFGDVLRNQALERGVRIIDRCMSVDLLKQDGRIVGAFGIPMESYDNYIFKAKATVICLGAGGFKPWGWPISALTSDGDAMAYRAGAYITGKEFSDTHFTCADAPAYFGFTQYLAGGPAYIVGRPPRGKLINAEGKEIPDAGIHAYFMEAEFEAHAGRAPIYIEPPGNERVRIVSGAASGMSQHKGEGIWPLDTDCSTNIPGLYAAGDSLGNMPTGAVYTAGFGLLNASVTGTIAASTAARYARYAEEPQVNQKEIYRLQKIIQGPLERKGGFSPRWVTQLLQNTMMPYFVLLIKEEKRLAAALTNVEFYQDQLVPKLFARDSHELRLAHETRNMVLNAEMRLRSALYRRESRGAHYREDYPRRDDPNWLAWVLLREENGEMRTIKRRVPKKWWPDLTEAYDNRYPAHFPLE